MSGLLLAAMLFTQPVPRAEVYTIDALTGVAVKFDEVKHKPRGKRCHKISETRARRKT